MENSSAIYMTLYNLPFPWKLQDENEIGVQIPEELWEESLEDVHQFSNDSKYCLLQFKVIRRLHYSQGKIAQRLPEGIGNMR